MCAGSNPAGGTLYEVLKDPVTSGNAEAGVFAYVSVGVGLLGGVFQSCQMALMWSA